METAGFSVLDISCYKDNGYILSIFNNVNLVGSQPFYNGKWHDIIEYGLI